MPSAGTIIILGATGLLGSQMLRTLRSMGTYRLRIAVRDPAAVSLAPGVDEALYPLDAETATVDELEDVLAGSDWAINCIGIIPPHIRDHESATVVRALQVNGLFPHFVAEAAARTRTRVLQIATDCVWDGADGSYVESNPHNALNVYGKTKSLGEVMKPGFYNLRCSIIGREDYNHLSLLEWFLGQEANATVKGFRNHLWNGVTSLHFAKVCHGIIASGMDLPHVQHLVPADHPSKEDLLRLFARYMGRKDITIEAHDTAVPVNRTIATSDTELNRRLWHGAGYDAPPDVATMVRELAEERRT